MSLALILLLAAAPRFGTVTDSAEGACVAVEGAAVAPGTHLIVIEPEVPHKALTARVETPLPDCEPLTRAGIGGVRYRLSWENERPESGFVGIAVLGAQPVHRIEGAVALDLGEGAHVAECTVAPRMRACI